MVATNREKRKLKGKEKIGLRVGKIINKFKVGKYFETEILKEKLKSVLFEDEEMEEINENTLNFVRSEGAKKKEGKKKNKNNDIVHSFRTLLEDLGTITLNKIKVNLSGKIIEFFKVTKPTKLQEKILKLLGISLYCTQ